MRFMMNPELAILKCAFARIFYVFTKINIMFNFIITHLICNADTNLIPIRFGRHNK